MSEGWKIRKLGEVCHVIAGQSPEGKYYNSEMNGLPFYQGKKEFQSKYIGEPTVWTTKTTKEARDNDILMSVRAPVGPINLCTQKICIGRGLAAIRAGDDINKEFLYDFLLKIEDELVGSNGAVFNSINKKQIESISIPLPPLPEQLRIVSILDKAFAAIDQAKANAEKNLKNAKELFESYLQRVFEKKGDGWEEITLKSVTTNITDGDHQPPPKSQSGIPFITISNINKENYEIDFSNTFKVPEDYFRNIKDNRRPIKGDILYTVTGSFGIPVIIKSNFEFCFQRHIALIRPENIISSKWLFYWILSPQAKKQANQAATGTAQRTVSLTALRNFRLPDISLSHQEAIVRKLDALSSETKKLEFVYQKQIAGIEELKKSILKKAFGGELTAIKEPVP